MRNGSDYGAILVVAVLTLAASGCSPAEEREMVFFYETICASCDETEQTQRLLTRVMEVRRRNELVSTEVYNVNRKAGRDALELMAAGNGIRADAVRLPALFVKDGEVIQGDEQVQAFISELE